MDDRVDIDLADDGIDIDLLHDGVHVDAPRDSTTSTCDTIASTSTRDTIASTSSWDAIASMSSLLTIASMSTLRTIASMSNLSTIAAMSTRRTMASTSTAATSSSMSTRSRTRAVRSRLSSTSYTTGGTTARDDAVDIVACGCPHLLAPTGERSTTRAGWRLSRGRVSDHPPDRRGRPNQAPRRPYGRIRRYRGRTQCRANRTGTVRFYEAPWPPPPCAHDPP